VKIPAVRFSLAVAALLVMLAAPARADVLPPVKHVFVIVLENKDFDESFPTSGTPQAPYLARELTAKGQLLRQYFGTSHVSLGNYITMISGQAPNPDTQSDCNAGYKDVFPGVVGPDGQAMGAGCVYPAAVKTLPDQLTQKGLSWRAYMEDMGADPTREAGTCGHPAIGAEDPTQSATASDQYAMRHNPFMYFHSIIDDQRSCDQHVVNLRELGTDLGTAAETPSFAFITPDLCSDGHDAPCADGRPGGLTSVDAFLKTWVPRIQASPAYAEGGLIVITWDEGNSPRPQSSGSCCGEPTGPNTPSPGVVGPGGGRTGTVVLSQFVTPGSVNDTPYNHYGLLRSIEDLFGLGHLGYAGMSSLKPFGGDVFGAAGTVDLTGPGSSKAPCTLRPLKAKRRRLAPGSLINGLKIERRSASRVALRVTTLRRARLYASVPGRRHALRARGKRCGSVVFALPRSHGRVRLSASVRQGTERRTIVY
jgi:phosphatidylinositol-3-phosphatase